MEITKEKLLGLLSEEPIMVLLTAYLYAKNYVNYGEDVTKTWTNTVQNASALEKAYKKGYYDASQRQVLMGKTSGEKLDGKGR